MALKTDYRDDGFTGNRKYRPITNSDSTQSFEDVTPYNPVGDSFGAKDINDTNKAVNAVTTPVYEDYTSTAVPDPDTALNNIKSNTALTTVLSNIKATLKGSFFKKYILTTMEQVMANTLAGRAVDALLFKKLNSDLTASGKIVNYEVVAGDGVYINYKDGADTVRKKLGSSMVVVGSGSSIDVKSKLPAYYSRLTADNFITQINSVSLGWSTGGRTKTDRPTYYLTKAYNPSTGIYTHNSKINAFGADINENGNGASAWLNIDTTTYVIY